MTRSEILRTLTANLALVAEETRGTEITESTDLQRLDIDSIALVEAVARTMRQLDVQVPGHLAHNVDTVGELVTLFEQAAPV